MALSGYSERYRKETAVAAIEVIKTELKETIPINMNAGEINPMEAPVVFRNNPSYPLFRNNQSTQPPLLNTNVYTLTRDRSK